MTEQHKAWRTALGEDGWEFFLERVAMRVESELVYGPSGVLTVPESFLAQSERAAFGEAVEHQKRLHGGGNE